MRLRRTNRNRRVTAVAAGLVAIALTATACGQADGGGDDDDGGGGDADATADAGATGAGEDEEVTIRFSWWGSDERRAMTDEAVDKFEAANPNITVETESVDFGAYFDRLSTSVAAGDEPDVITMGGAYPREYGDRGVLLDLSTVSDELDLSVLDEAPLEQGNFNGVQYGVPTGVNTFGLVVNPRLFEEAGVDLPDDDSWSWDDFVEIATEISAGTPEDVYGVEDPTSADMLDLYANQKTGLGLYTEEGGIAIEPDTVARWWEMTTGLMDAGATPPASLTVELNEAPPEQTLIGQGKAAMRFGWSNLLATYAEASGDELVMLRVPGETTDEGPGMWLQASQLYTISANTEHPEAAAKLVDFLVSSEEAADSIGADRGIPANAELREYLAQDLEPIRQTEFEYIDRISEVVDGHFVIGPTGSTDTRLILTRLNDSVLFDQISPEDAAEQFVQEITAAVS